MQQRRLLPPVAEAQAQADVDQSRSQGRRSGHAGGGLRRQRGALSVSAFASALDFFYGIDANQFAATHQHPTDATGRSTLPNYQVANRQNLGYSAQVTLNIPVWNWGATRSKVKQAELKRDQAQLDLIAGATNAAKQSGGGYAEAQAAQAQLDSLRSSVDLAAESLRLTLLRYQAGEATALEVVDAQNTVTQARNAYDDGLARYRVALANLQTLTGTL